MIYIHKIQIQIEALNDSKYIGVCIYNVVILATLGVAINFVLGETLDASYGFTSSFIILGTTLTQGLVFVPKVGVILAYILCNYQHIFLLIYMFSIHTISILNLMEIFI